MKRTMNLCSLNKKRAKKESVDYFCMFCFLSLPFLVWIHHNHHHHQMCKKKETHKTQTASIINDLMCLLIPGENTQEQCLDEEELLTEHLNDGLTAA